jgi:nicotinamide-nucleotide amidase
MRAEIVAVGRELLLGETINQNAAFLSKALSGIGIFCHRHTTADDQPDRLKDALWQAMMRSDLVIVSGGLGPTKDDITLKTLASLIRRPLVLDPKLLSQIERRFKRIGLPMPASNRRQAMILKGANVLPNLHGTAPGLFIPIQLDLTQPIPKRYRIPSQPKMVRRILVALPGPPSELIPMVNRFLLPRLRRFGSGKVIQSRTLKIALRSESEIEEKIRDLMPQRGRVTVGIYPHPGEIHLRLTAWPATPPQARRRLMALEKKIRQRLGTLIFGNNTQTLEEVVGKLLRRAHKTIAVAESCTGGLLQQRLTRIPGASDYFLGGVVAYSNAVKTSCVGVPPSLIRRYGAVSDKVAIRMAGEIRERLHADLGVAITGIAGPKGGTRRKPVGLVYIALATDRGIPCFPYRFSGDRTTIQWKAAQAALEAIRMFTLHRFDSAQS